MKEKNNRKKITVIVQARTGSKRLPKKILKKILNKPMIWYVLKRIKKIKRIEQIVIATTIEREDDVIIKIVKENKISLFRGESSDVLDRFYNCAKKFDADPIIRITSDCPLIDPFLVDEILEFYLNHNFDYVSNTIEPTYPDGLDVEIFSFKTLENAAMNAKMKSEREHVSSHIKNHPKKFSLHNFRNEEDFSIHRWTVDEKEDLVFVRKIYNKMKPKIIFRYQDVLQILSDFPDLLKINKNFKRNEGYRKSLKHDSVLKRIKSKK